MARIQAENLFEEIKSNKVQIVKTQREVNLTEDQLAETFIPEIYEDDNELCKIIKQTLIDNPINLKIYAHRFTNEQEMSNMKRSLNKNRTMTWERFMRWCYVLGYDAEIGITPKEDNTY